MSMCAYVNACRLRYFLGGIIFYAFYLCQSVFHPLFQYAFERPFKISFGARYIFFTWIFAENCTFRGCEDVYIAVGFIYLPKALLDGGKVSSKNILLVLKQHVCIKTDLILMEKRGRGKKKGLVFQSGVYNFRSSRTFYWIYAFIFQFGRKKNIFLIPI